jgi:hypothetical protein
MRIEQDVKGKSVAVGRPIARDAPAQIPACGITAPGSSEILASVIK